MAQMPKINWIIRPTGPIFDGHVEDKQNRMWSVVFTKEEKAFDYLNGFLLIQEQRGAVYYFEESKKTAVLIDEEGVTYIYRIAHVFVDPSPEFAPEEFN